MKINLLFLSFSHDMAKGVNANRVFELLHYFVSLGISVSLITPYKSFEIKGVENIVVEPSLPKPSRLSLLFTNLLKSLYSVPDTKQEEQWIKDVEDYLLKNKSEQKFDIVYANVHPVCVAELGVIAKKIFNSKLIVDYQDPFFLNPYKRNLPLFDPFLKKREKAFLDQTDVLIVNQPSAKSVYQQHYPILLVEFIPNIMPSNMPRAHRDNRSKNIQKILYGGSLYIGRDLFQLLNAIKKVNKKFQIEVLGNFSFINLQRYKKYKFIFWKNKINPEEYFSYLNNEVDIGVVLQSFNIRKTGISAIASKTYEYLYLNRAIIYIGPNGDNADLIRRYSNNHCIITQKWGGEDVIARFLKHFKNQAENTKRSFYKEYTISEIFKPYKGILIQLGNS